MWCVCPSLPPPTSCDSSLNSPLHSSIVSPLRLLFISLSLPPSFLLHSLPSLSPPPSPIHLRIFQTIQFDPIDVNVTFLWSSSCFEKFDSIEGRIRDNGHICCPKIKENHICSPKIKIRHICICCNAVNKDSHMCSPQTKTRTPQIHRC